MPFRDTHPKQEKALDLIKLNAKGIRFNSSKYSLTVPDSAPFKGNEILKKEKQNKNYIFNFNKLTSEDKFKNKNIHFF